MDFFGNHPNYDYNISMLAEYIGVSRPTLYKLNTKNKITKAILKFDFEISQIIAEQEEKITIL